MQIAPGSLVRPIISIAGLDARRQYLVREILCTAFTSIAYLEDSNGALLAPVMNAHTVLEPVKCATTKPTLALFN